MVSNINKATVKIIKRLYNNGSLDKATLAALRSTTDITDKRAEKVWPLFFDGVDESIVLSRDGQPTHAEKAIYTTLHCYAIFQQGTEELVYAASGENQKGVTFFNALKQIGDKDSDAKAALDRRVSAILASTNTAAVINSLVHLVQILKGKKLNLQVDFGKLAQDLYWFQSNPESARKVALNWGRDYYWNVYTLENKGEK
ncbi:type I-E CRISPR-associated protein Cse2/CasB [Lactobacillus hamsteri]|uniref:CRISPR-associated protein, cse2 n=1 Tax=Lactobacillus hamsteri DSM 5661 = JCM 6256 TaxID=1423754 RepID=A0A0R1YGP2_9LACO|nr:type I-E CRISPR-associated protein Cse2/CasB [Lactobacillus hamsteri]KRM38172.1 CRISPR-associated protein, cse2 [Lactobacillus hamsteri DSM 5661 = JCM 6256]